VPGQRQDKAERRSLAAGQLRKIDEPATPLRGRRSSPPRRRPARIRSGWVDCSSLVNTDGLDRRITIVGGRAQRVGSFEKRGGGSGGLDAACGRLASYPAPDIATGKPRHPGAPGCACALRTICWQRWVKHFEPLPPRASTAGAWAFAGPRCGCGPLMIPGNGNRRGLHAKVRAGPALRSSDVCSRAEVNLHHQEASVDEKRQASRRGAAGMKLTGPRVTLPVRSL